MTHSLQDPRLLRILSAALRAVDPAEAVRRHLPEVTGRVYGLGIGKAAIPMLAALAEARPLAGALAISKHAPAPSGEPFPVLLGGHPVPDERSLEAGRRALAFVSGLDVDDTLICLLSGGGSALVTVPQAGLTLADLQHLTSLLLACGARIDEINTLRRQLDGIKGGGLARATRAHVISLILSDVVGSPLEAVASGPTYPDPTTAADALAILRKYRLEEQVPEAISKTLHSGSARARQGRLPLSQETVPFSEVDEHTPTPHSVNQKESSFAQSRQRAARVQNHIIADNRLAAEAAAAEAQRQGIDAEILTNALQGEAREVGLRLAHELKSQLAKRPRPFCLIAGGETTVTIQGSGKGGRNQELALAAVDELADERGITLVALATDGEDGPTDAAGAVVTGETAARARALGLSPVHYLARNDTYVFFEALGDLLKPGPTGTNVNDLVFLIAS